MLSPGINLQAPAARSGANDPTLLKSTPKVGLFGSDLDPVRTPDAYRVDAACHSRGRMVAKALQNYQQTRQRPHPGHLCGSAYVESDGLREVESSAGERAPTPRPLVDTGSP